MALNRAVVDTVRAPLDLEARDLIPLIIPADLAHTALVRVTLELKRNIDQDDLWSLSQPPIFPGLQSNHWTPL